MVLRLRHVVDRPLHGDYALQVKAVYVVDRADGDFGVGVLHDSLDRVAALADDPADQIVVRQDLEGDFRAAGKRAGKGGVGMSRRWPERMRTVALTPCSC